MVKKDPCALIGQLPRLVETVVKSLDPHTPALRDACLKATTAVLHVMVKVTSRACYLPLVTKTSFRNTPWCHFTKNLSA